jgi:hypothetical protein
MIIICPTIYTTLQLVRNKMTLFFVKYSSIQKMFQIKIIDLRKIYLYFYLLISVQYIFSEKVGKARIEILIRRVGLNGR